MWSVNQTRPHCVNQMGKTHSKPLAARHGRGTAWARHTMCESALRRSRQTSSARRSNEKGDSQKHIHWSLDKPNLRWPILFCAQYFPLNLLLEYIIIIIITILFCYVQYFPFKVFYFSIGWWFLYVIYITGLLLGDPYSRVIRTVPPTRSPNGRRLDIDSWKYMLLLKSF
jgi:hypothetical protein